MLIIYVFILYRMFRLSLSKRDVANSFVNYVKRNIQKHFVNFHSLLHYFQEQFSNSVISNGI